MNNLEYLRCTSQGDPNLLDWGAPGAPDVGQVLIDNTDSGFYNYTNEFSYVKIVDDIIGQQIVLNQNNGGGPFVNHTIGDTLYGLGECIGGETIICPESKASVCAETRFGADKYFSNCPYPEDKEVPAPDAAFMLPVVELENLAADVLIF